MTNKNTNYEWKVSEKRPGYFVRTTTRGCVTANVYKPIPTAEGRIQREQAKMAKDARMIGPVMNPKTR